MNNFGGPSLPPPPSCCCPVLDRSSSYLLGRDEVVAEHRGVDGPGDLGVETLLDVPVRGELRVEGAARHA